MNSNNRQRQSSQKRRRQRPDNDTHYQRHRRRLLLSHSLLVLFSTAALLFIPPQQQQQQSSSLLVQAWIHPTTSTGQRATEWESVHDMRRRLNRPFNYTPSALHAESCRHLTQAQCQAADMHMRDHARQQQQIQHSNAARVGASGMSVAPTKVLVLLITFSDHTSRPHVTQANVQERWTGLIKDWFRVNSHGIYDIDPYVTQWIVTDNTESHYAAGVSGFTTNLHKMAWPALTQLDNEGFDWAAFDQDNNNEIDNVVLIHSGYDASTVANDEYGTPSADRVWAHAFALTSDITPWTSSGGYKMTVYTVASSLDGITGTNTATIGVTVHEYMHTMGLPDLYDLTDATYPGVGAIDIMAWPHGANGDGNFPGHLSTWCQKQVGWLAPTLIENDGVYTLAPLEQNAQAYEISLLDFGGIKEYLYLENRQQLEFDADLWGSGLVIYHIDDTANGQTYRGYPGQVTNGVAWPANGLHYEVALLAPDGNYDLEQGVNRGDTGDMWQPGQSLGPGQSNSVFPNTDAYSSGYVFETGFTITVMQGDGQNVKFEVSGVGPALQPTGPPTPQPVATASPTMMPTTLAPTTLQPTTGAPTSLQPTTGSPTSLQPTTGAPTSLQPTTGAPTSLQPTTLAPTSLQPTTGAPTSLQPTTGAPTSLQPTTLTPTSLQPTTGAPTSLQPTSLAPTTMQPSELPSMGPTTTAPSVAATTASPTMASTTASPTMVSTTAVPTPIATTTSPTMGPTTAMPTFAATTTSPTMVQTTVAPSAVVTASPTLGQTTTAPASAGATSTPTSATNTATPTTNATTGMPSLPANTAGPTAGATTTVPTLASTTVSPTTGAATPTPSIATTTSQPPSTANTGAPTQSTTAAPSCAPVAGSRRVSLRSNIFRQFSRTGFGACFQASEAPSGGPSTTTNSPTSTQTAGPTSPSATTSPPTVTQTAGPTSPSATTSSPTATQATGPTKAPSTGPGVRPLPPPSYLLAIRPYPPALSNGRSGPPTIVPLGVNEGPTTDGGYDFFGSPPKEDGIVHAGEVFFGSPPKEDGIVDTDGEKARTDLVPIATSTSTRSPSSHVESDLVLVATSTSTRPPILRFPEQHLISATRAKQLWWTAMLTATTSAIIFSSIF